MEKCLKEFNTWLNRSFGNLGRRIVNNTGYYIVIPVLITCIFATGIQQMDYKDDPEYLFAPYNGRGKIERRSLKEHFHMNSSTFEPSRIVHDARFAKFYVYAKDGGTVMRQDIWDDILKMHHYVQNLNIEDEQVTLKYADICATWNGYCYENTILQLYNLLPEFLDGSLLLEYPVMINPYSFEIYPISMFTGGVVVNETLGTATYIKAIVIYYWLKDDTEREILRAERWERKLVSDFNDSSFDYIDIARYTSLTPKDELDENTRSIYPRFGIASIIMGVFTITSMYMSDWVRSKPILGLVGMLTATMASITAFGLLMYLGVPFICINLAAPFLMLGIGIDDMFVLLAAWRRTNIQDSVTHRMIQTYSEAAVSITITSVTDVISFFVGVLTPFKSVQIFCIYTGTAVIVTYFFFITFFGGCMVIAGRIEAAQRHSVTLVPVKPKSLADKENSYCYAIWCSGGINKEDPWNAEDNKDHAIMIFFRDNFAKKLNKPIFKVMVLFIFIIYASGAVYGCLNIKEGLEGRHISLYDSYAVQYFDIHDEYFRKYPYRIQVMITGDLEYGKPETQNKIMKLHSQFENLSVTTDEFYTESWMRGWYKFLENNNKYLQVDIYNETNFIYNLRKYYLEGSNNMYNLDIEFNENYTRIVASRFHVLAYDLKTLNDDRDMMTAVREVADASELNVTVFNIFFVFLDQYLLIRRVSIQTITIAAIIMLFVSYAFIPNLWCSVLVAFSIISIEIGVVGYMSLWGVNLDAISMINLIMCIGFSVDFTAHISYSYLTANAKTKEERVETCLYTLGLPILQGAVSTILGVLILSTARSYIFVTFFKTIVLVIFFGAIHGLLLLPVLLSIFGPASNAYSSDNPSSKLSVNQQTYGAATLPNNISRSTYYQKSINKEVKNNLNPFDETPKNDKFSKPADNVISKRRPNMRAYNNHTFIDTEDEKPNEETIIFSTATTDTMPRLHKVSGSHC